MHDWEKFNETSLPGKEHFYSHLSMEDITDLDYGHAKRVCKDFKIKRLGEYIIDIDMIFMLEKGGRAGICHSIYQYAKANKKYMKGCRNSFVQLNM